MYLESLREKALMRTTRILLIGAGQYGNSFIFQSERIPGLEVIAVCDRDPDRGVQTFIHAGRAREDIAICDSAVSASLALQQGRAVVAVEALMLMDLPFDIVIEATGSPEAAVVHAMAALKHGKHVAMVSKEADSTVGPLLHAKAQEAGLVYTPVDGDQPSLLMQMVEWARLLGLDVLCAGKSSEYDFVYHRRNDRVECLDRLIPAAGMQDLWDLGGRTTESVFSERAKVLEDIPQHTVPDLIEMALVANAVGFKPDVPELHAPVARLGEIADFLAPKDYGGILSEPGVVDVVNFLREPGEMSMAGGVFVIVACEDRKTWEVLRAKGHVLNRRGTAAMIYRPTHLLGVESATTVLTAVLEKRSSGPSNAAPAFDVAGRTTKALPAGTLLQAVGHHHTIDGVAGIMQPACAVTGSNPVPYYMMEGHCLKEDVSAGSVITVDMLERPPGSLLWSLRMEMDTRFGLQ